MDGIAVKLERLKREARKEWQRKWRKKLRDAAPSTRAEWRGLAGDVAIGFLKIVLDNALGLLEFMANHEIGQSP